jgi:phenylacetate-CoA ligase
MLSALYTKFVAGVLFPLHEKLKKHDTVRIKKQLEKSQWFSKDKIIKNQESRLAQFIKNIYVNVPYYKQIFDQINLSPNDIETVGDLAKLPFLAKEEIKNNFKQLTSNIAGPLQKFNTGGSSGSPLIFLLGNERVSHDVAEKWRATRWWDVDIGDKEIVAWGSPIELNSQDKIKLVRDKLFRSLLIPAFDLNDEKLSGFIQKIREYKPAMLFGYPSVYELIAKYAEKHKICMNDLGIKVVLVTSERLYPHQREKIEAVFGCQVANGYGSRDAGFIAHQCPHGGMHLSAEDIIVEIIDANGNTLPEGESGEIVVTHLGTSDFPFIRYKTGDIAAISKEQCSCGRGLPMLKDIQGRTTDFIVAADGTMMHGLALIYVLREINEVGEFKITQETLLATHVQIVPREGFSDENVEQIISGFKSRLGDKVTINVEVVEKILAEKSGKFRYVISKVAGMNL